MRIVKDELYHHGIKGQKWGVRRFENEDGTLTPEGKERYKNQKYNQDSDNLAIQRAKVYHDLAEVQTAKNDLQKSINKKGVWDKSQAQKLQEKYEDAVKYSSLANLALQELAKKQKYDKIDFNYFAEAKTGEVYCQSILTDKTGEKYISEFYTGVRSKGRYRKDTPLY